jgi:hypothetical protein
MGCSSCINFVKFKHNPYNHGGMCDVYDWNVKSDSKPKDCKYFNPFPYERNKQKIEARDAVNG